MIRPYIVRATVQPKLIATGVATVLRIAGGGAYCPYNFAGVPYRAGVAELPRFQAAIDYQEQGWTGGVIPTTGTLRWAPSLKADYDTFSTAYLWKDAAITIEQGFEGADGSEPTAWTTVLVGAVADVAAQDGILSFTNADFSVQVSKPFLNAARFAGTGGIEGIAEAANRTKRRSFGAVYNVEGRILDKANQVWEFGDPAFPLNAITTLRDKGRAAAPAPTVLAWQGSIAATFAALQASAPATGSGVVAPSIACAKWWTQPAGPLTADIQGEVGAGYVNLAASVAERILQARGGPALAAGELAAANAIRPDAVGIHIDDDNMTTAQALDQLLLGVSLVWILEPAGTVRFRAFSFAAPVEAITSQLVTREKILPPVKSRKFGYQRNQRIHSDAEIAASLLVGDLSGPVDWQTQVGGAAKPADNATSDLNLTSIGSQAVSIAGNSVSRLAGNGDLNAHVRGEAFKGACYIEADILAGAIFTVIVLDDDATSTADAGLLVRTTYRPSDGYWDINQNGVLLFTGFTTTNLTGKLRLAYDGVRFRAFLNATQIGSDVAAAASLTLWPKWIAYNGPAVTYTGLLAAPYTSNSWSDTGGAGRPADNAGTTIQLLLAGAGAAEILGNSGRRTDAVALYTWNQALFSKEYQVGTAFISAKALAPGTMLGLADNNAIAPANASQSYFEIDYGWNFSAAGSWSIWESGTLAASLGASFGGVTFSASTQLLITYDGVNVRYYADGVLVRTIASASGRKFYAAAGLAGQNSQASEIQFGPYTDNAWSSTGGAGKPDDNATRNVVRGAWAGGVAYAVGDIVQYANGSWHCATAHTSNVSFPPGNASNTQFISLALQGNYRDTIFIRQPSQPSTPSGTSPSGWSGGVPTGTDTLWQSWALRNYAGALLTAWSTPGRITGVNPRGTYAGGTTYYLNDVVTYNGGSYLASQNGFSGQAPSGTSGSNSYWDVLAAPGATGAPATPPGAFSSTISIGGQTATVNLRTLADAAGYTGSSNATITFNVTGNVTALAGGKAIDTGTWPSGSYTITLTLNVQAGVTVAGGGGAGGDSGYGDGSPGGDAIYCQEALTIVNSGAIRGGGGGGGSGSGQTVTPPGQFMSFTDPFYGGGGGGGGAPNGPGGAGEAGTNGGTSGSNGSAGTTGGGGAGGSGYQVGASGGGYGAAGSSSAGGGGAAGYAVRKNGKAVSASNGTVSGTWA